MFACRSCTWRTLLFLAAETIPTAKPLNGFIPFPGRNRVFQPRRHVSDAIFSRVPGKPYLNAAQIRHRDQVKFDSVNESEERKVLSEEARNLRKELIYLTDPLKLSDHIRLLVSKGQVDKATALCRLASKSMNCVVGWNHIIDWHMKGGETKEAFRLYNEMKKRAQFPDSYTYLLLFRGLAAQQNGATKKRIPYRENTARAVDLYESMKQPTSRVKPSIIHTNAALRVCSQSMDMQAVWGIVSAIPDNGPNAADRVTYTTILQAIKHSATELNTRTASLGNVKIRKRHAAQEGRELWTKIVQKWRAGVIAMDEELVHAMARVLMQSPDISDWDAVLTLVQQTTNIPRLIPKVGTPERQIAHVPEQTDAISKKAVRAEVKGAGSATSVDIVFEPLRLDMTSGSNRGRGIAEPAYAKPGNAILSVVLDACAMMRVPKAFIQYWDIFITEHDIRPDLTNLHSVLRQLALNRSSSKAVLVLQNVLASKGLRGSERTFILAITCCIRDKKNPNVVDNAIKILDLMNEVRGQPSIDVLSAYLKLVSQPECAEHANKAMSRLIGDLGSFGHVASLDGGVHFLRSVAGATHRLITIGGVKQEDKLYWEGQRNQLNQAIAQYDTARIEKARSRAPSAWLSAE